MRAEVEEYGYLIADGGRPWYPFHLLDRVSKNPRKYHDLLRFWCSGDKWLVYTHQWERWQKFRVWQRDNRGDLDVQDEFEREKADLIRIWVKYGKDLSKIDTEEQWAQEFERVKNRRGWQHRYTVEGAVVGKRGEARFPAYVQAMRARLDRHGFSRPVRLDQDHQQQDPLTTWIEYLNYEYWIHDGFADKAAKLQTQYETRLRELMDANVLLPGETPESVCEFHHGFIIQRQKEVANEAVNVAETAVSVAKKALDSTSRDTHRQGQEVALARARERLKKAVEAEDTVKKRSELIFKFGSVNNPFNQSKQKAENHQILLQWILDQVPLIEAEMAEPEGDAPFPTGQKRARADSDELESEEPAAKRHEPGTTPTAQDVQPEANHLPEPPAQSLTKPGRKRAREDDSEGEPEMPDTKKQKPNIQADPEVDAKPKIRTTRAGHAQTRQDHEEPGSEPRPKQATKLSNKATGSPRQPRSRKDSPEQSASPRPSALQKPAPTALDEAAPQQATIASSPTPPSKAIPAPSKRKRAEEEEPPQRSQSKRRRGGR
jgi:hypothetical protein